MQLLHTTFYLYEFTANNSKAAHDLSNKDNFVIM